MTFPGIRYLTALVILLLAAPVSANPKQQAAEILKKTNTTGGLIVHEGAGDGELTTALWAGPGYLVLGLDTDYDKIAAARRRAENAGLSGKVTFAHWDGKQLPLADNVVNLLVAEELEPTTSGHEITRVLAPEGAAYVKWPNEMLKLGNEERQTLVKERPASIDRWTHFLRDASGNPVAKVEQVGPPRHMQWKAGPEWTRSHHKLASISTVVSDGRRLYYIMDEGPSASLEVPGRWTLVARDAFNGLLLWQRKISSWADWRRGFRSGPVQVTRLLVADDNKVFTTLGVDGPLMALDPVSGETVHTYEQTAGTEEVLFEDGALFVMTATPMTAQSTAGPKPKRQSNRAQAGGTKTPRRPGLPRYQRSLLAIDADSSKTLWRWTPEDNEGNPTPVTLSADARRVFFQLGDSVVCLDRTTGEKAWRSAGTKSGPTTPQLMTNETLVVYEDVVLWAHGKTLSAMDAEDGELLWECPCEVGFRSSTDVFVADGLVWVGKSYRDGRDPRTGEVKRTRDMLADIQTAGHHHRCYRNKATERYILEGYRGIEFLDLCGENHSRNNWTRGGCQYGILPCNGLIYAPSHACGCYMEAKLFGFWAMSAERQSDPRGFEGDRLVKGPAYQTPPTSLARRSTDWPTYRGNPMRSGATNDAISPELTERWKVALGKRLSPPVVANGIAVISDIDAQRIVAVDADSGELRWSVPVGGRVDSPPTIHGNRVLFGSADGWVHCVQVDDGVEAWRFMAAPEDRRTVVDDRLESVWPVHGSILVEKEVAYFSAGRSSYLDGGIMLYGLDPTTGEILHQTHLTSAHPIGSGVADGDSTDIALKKFAQNATDSRTFLAADKSDAFSMDGGVTSDVMVSNGQSVFLRHVRLDRELNTLPTKTGHLFSTSRLIDDTETHRSHWVLGTGDFSRLAVAYSWIVNGRNNRFGCEPTVPFAMIMSFDNSTVWGVKRVNNYEGYTLFAGPNIGYTSDKATGRDFRDVDKNASSQRFETRWKWAAPLSSRPRCILQAGDSLLLAGMPADLDASDPMATFEGRRGGTLLVFDATSGEEQATLKMRSPATWDGMAVANGRLYITTMDGHLVCFSE